MSTGTRAVARPEERAWIGFTLALISAAELTLILFSLVVRDAGIFLYANLVAVSSMSVGGLFGFLFGIPRSLANSNSPPSDESVGSGSGSGQSDKGFYRANTNLEQISDWLTKILVGVGLTQLNSMPSLISQLGTYLSDGAQNENFTPPLAAITSVGFVVIGFILVYLWTRIYLGSQFAQADLEMFGKKIDARLEEFSQEIDREIEEELSSRLERQNNRDASALNIVERWLGSGAEYGYSSDQVTDAVLLASAPVQTQIFFKARNSRRTHLPEQEIADLTQRTIPVFEALIKGGPKEFLHQYHGQLGYALHDRPNATNEELDRAIDELSQAIVERQKAGRSGHETYELVRAVCRIRRDQNFQDATASDTSIQKEIIEDLRAALKSIPDLVDNPVVLRWLEVNKIKDLNQPGGAS